MDEFILTMAGLTVMAIELVGGYLLYKSWMDRERRMRRMEVILEILLNRK